MGKGSERMTKDEFRNLKQGCLVRNKNNRLVYLVDAEIKDVGVQAWKLKDIKYGMVELINSIISKDYDVVKEVKE